MYGARKGEHDVVWLDSVHPEDCAKASSIFEKANPVRAIMPLSGDAPSKEICLHNAFYETRPQTGAVVHLHSTFATALSCLTDIDPDDCVPPLTPYVVMRVGQVKLVPYVRPGMPRPVS
ncbi:class II aldolase/adducin family protein [Rhizobium tibeticum]|uniref:class II aldolase/adducin family protein n=1 Tax=Rhizobium tibeticum TaxID=501024 RepID=UPI0027D7A628|nr:class II aldolase/adducin family protein [Rhizobium tibeticum]